MAKAGQGEIQALLKEGRKFRPSNDFVKRAGVKSAAIYKEAARLPPDAVLVELPLGYPDFDLRAMYYSLVRGTPKGELSEWLADKWETSSDGKTVDMLFGAIDVHTPT